MKQTKRTMLATENQSGVMPDLEIESHARISFRLPVNDAAPQALRAYREANERFRTVQWPTPFDRTTHPFNVVAITYQISRAATFFALIVKPKDMVGFPFSFAI
jgi:hypothetical protein